MSRNLFLRIKLLGLFLIPFQGVHGQFHKLWEFTLEGNGIYPISYDINGAVPLRTFQTSDGEFIVVSLIENGPGSFPQIIYLYRFDSSGNVKWEYRYPSSYGINEDIYDASMDPLGNILVGAKTTTYYSGGFEPTESSNALLLKISPNGELVWQQEGPLPSYPASQRTISNCSDAEGNVYSASTIINQHGGLTVIEKWSTDGDSIWKTYLEYSYFTHMKVVDGLLVVIFTQSPSRIFHFSLEGELIFSGEIPKVTSGKKPVFDQDGNWYNLHPTGKFKIEKRNILGEVVWEYNKPTNLPSNVFADEIEDCTIDKDGNVFITGRYYGPHYGDTSLYSNCDILTVKLNSAGTYQWEDLYQYTDLRSCQVGERIQVNDEGLVFVAGYQSVREGNDPYFSSDMVILAYDIFGHRIDSTFYDGISSKEDNGVNLLLSDDAIYLLGWSQQQDDLYDQVIIKYDRHLTSVTQYDNTSERLKIFPNPVVEDGFFISCESPSAAIDLYDLTGKKIMSEKNYNCGSFFKFSQPIQDGLYILTIRMPEKIISKKIIIANKK